MHNNKAHVLYFIYKENIMINDRPLDGLRRKASDRFVKPISRGKEIGMLARSDVIRITLGAAG
jgi:hypothetical protein